MGLSLDLIAKRNVIVRDGVSFSVRGLSAEDVMVLLGAHAPQMMMAYGKVMDTRRAGGISEATMKKTLLDFSREFPQLTGALIARAADSTTEAEVQVARQLPLPVQLEAMVAIFELTFTSEAAVKKFIQSLTDAALAVSGAMNTLTSEDSQSGIGASAGM